MNVTPSSVGETLNLIRDEREAGMPSVTSSKIFLPKEPPDTCAVGGDLGMLATVATAVDCAIAGLESTGFA